MALLSHPCCIYAPRMVVKSKFIIYASQQVEVGNIFGIVSIHSYSGSCITSMEPKHGVSLQKFLPPAIGDSGALKYPLLLTICMLLLSILHPTEYCQTPSQQHQVGGQIVQLHQQGSVKAWVQVLYGALPKRSLKLMWNEALHSNQQLCCLKGHTLQCS